MQSDCHDQGRRFCIVMCLKRLRIIAECKNLTTVDNCSVKTPHIQLKILDIHILHRGFLRNY